MILSLCQAERGSCGACCGLYNRPDRSRAALERLLAERTARVAGAARRGDATAVGKYVRRAGTGGPERPFPFLPDCPLLGFLDAGRRRVGCLVHPAVTGGWDGRGLGAHGAEICRDYLCPSHSILSEREIALASAFPGEDWYLYGLTVTDPDFLRAVLALVEERLLRSLSADELRSPAGRSALGPVLAFKEDWPYADPRVCLGLVPRGEADPPPYRLETAPGASPHERRLLERLGVRHDRVGEGLRLVRRRIGAAAALLDSKRVG